MFFMLWGRTLQCSELITGFVIKNHPGGPWGSICGARIQFTAAACKATARMTALTSWPKYSWCILHIHLIIALVMEFCYSRVSEFRKWCGEEYKIYPSLKTWVTLHYILVSILMSCQRCRMYRMFSSFLLFSFLCFLSFSLFNCFMFIGFNSNVPRD